MSSRRAPVMAASALAALTGCAPPRPAVGRDEATRDARAGIDAAPVAARGAGRQVPDVVGGDGCGAPDAPAAAAPGRAALRERRCRLVEVVLDARP